MYSPEEMSALWRHCLDFVLKKDAKFLILFPDEVVDKSTLETLKDLIDRLKKEEPIQYITGYAWFDRLKFAVSPGVLIPRPETEELVSWISETMRETDLKILDIGTGSGCIAISLKDRHPEIKIHAVDLSAEAIETALKNEKNLLENMSIQWWQDDVLNADFMKDTHSEYDIIVSNPPYIPESEKETMPLRVVDHEPHMALYSQEDPLLFYNSISKHALRLLKPGGKLFFETHENYHDQVLNLLKFLEFNEIQSRKDLQGKLRMVKAQKAS